MAIPGTVPDVGEGLRQQGGILDENEHAADHVADGHDGNQETADAGNALHAAQDDRRRDGGHDAAGDPAQDQVGLGFDVLAQQVDDGAGLEHVADSEGGDGGEDGKQHAQPFLAEAVLEGVHRAAGMAAVGQAHAVLHGQHGLGVLGGDAEDTGEPHPEHGARTADRDGAADPDDVAGADGRGESGHERAELGDLALTLRLAREGDADGARQVALDEAGADAEEEVRAEQQHDEGRAPDPGGEVCNDSGEVHSRLLKEPERKPKKNFTPDRTTDRGEEERDKAGTALQRRRRKNRPIRPRKTSSMRPGSGTTTMIVPAV